MTKGKGLSWFVTNGLGFRNTRLVANTVREPPRGLDTVLRTLRRRLDDRVSEVFNMACVAGDVLVAERLLALLEEMHERRRGAHERERRAINDDLVVRARREMQRLRDAKAKEQALAQATEEQPEA